VAEGPSPFVSGLLRRPVVTLRPPLDSCKKTGVRLEKGSRVVVVADSEGAGKLLCEQLESRGVQVLRIDARPERAEIEAALHTWAQAGNVAGLYFLPALDRSAPLSDIDLVQFRKLYRDRVLLLHGAARGLYETLNPGCFVISATRMGGQHGYGAAGAINSVGGAVTGFTKTLRRERPDLLAKAVDFEDGASAELVARALLDETERDPGAVEIGYAGGLRVTVGLEVMQAVPTDAKSPVKLDQNTVFAVTGGAGPSPWPSCAIWRLRRVARSTCSTRAPCRPRASTRCWKPWSRIARRPSARFSSTSRPKRAGPRPRRSRRSSSIWNGRPAYWKPCAGGAGGRSCLLPPGRRAGRGGHQGRGGQHPRRERTH